MSSAIVVQKPPSDTREYRFVQLDNELKVMLISDPKSEKGAAALDMGVGQFSDPESLPGLAHFLEHMLFLGTEKYPDEETYSKTLAGRGGRSNAYTQFEDTVYFFDVAAPALEEMLDIYAQFFVGPLFSESATGRELNAVDSEHNKNLQQDIWRVMQLMRSTSTSDYPFAKFGTGSKETLETRPKEAGINVRDALLEFHGKYYSSSIGTLAVLGTESLDELEAMVRSKFSEMPNLGISRPVHVEAEADGGNATGLPFGDGGVGQWFSVVPVKDTRSVSLWFPVMSCTKHHRTRPASVLGHLFGHESEGSILAALKAADWATELSAGLSGLSSRDFDIFTVSITLTEAGEAHVNEVIDTVFAYVGVLQQEGAAGLGWVHDELQAMGKVSFATHEPTAPLKAALSIASNLQHVPPEDVLAFDTLILDDYEPSLVEALLGSLSPHNVRIVYSSKAVEDVATSTEEWYGTAYEQHAVEPELAERWAGLASGAEPGAGRERGLALPQPNEFVPDDLSIKSISEEVSDPAGYAPQLLETEDPFTRVWHKQDNVFYTPKAAVCAMVRTPAAYGSPRSVVLTALAINMMKEQLNTYSYYASVAGLKYALAYDPKGMVVQVSGISQKLAKLAGRVAETLAAPALDSQTLFETQRDRMRRAYLNARKQQPYMHAFEATKAGLIEPEWSSEQKLAVIESVTLDAVREHVKALFGTFSVEALVHGNVTPSEAKALVAGMVDPLKEAYGSLPLAAAQKPARRVVSLAASGLDAPAVFALVGPNADDVNSALYAVYQIGPSTPETDVKAGLLAQVLKQPSFMRLRTQQQLGYIVDVGESTMEGIRGVRAVIQSSVADPQGCDAALESALAEIRAELDAMPQDEWEAHVNSLRVRVSERDKQLGQETNRFWAEVTSERYVFDRVSQQLAFLDTVTKQDLCDWYDATVSPSNKAAAYVYGAAHAESWAQSGSSIGVEPVAFRASSFMFPSVW